MAVAAMVVTVIVEVVVLNVPLALIDEGLN
jgi:hypothetical protein